MHFLGWIVIRNFSKKGSLASVPQLPHSTDVNNQLRTPADIAGLFVVWGKSYNEQYDSLRKKGRLERSTPDSEKFYEAVKSKIDPREIAKDHAEDAVLHWVADMAHVGVVLEWVNLPVVQALKKFFESSEISTDYDELRLANLQKD